MVIVPTPFAVLVGVAAPELRALGFRRRGSTFGLRYNEGWGLVNFQSSTWSTRAVAKVTINLAISLDILRRFQVYPQVGTLRTAFDPVRARTTVPLIGERHWEDRLDTLMPDGQGLDPVEWPHVHLGSEDTDGRPLVDAIGRYAVPFLDRHVSIEETYDLLTTIEGWSVIDPVERYVYRAALASVLNRADVLAAIDREYRQYYAESPDVARRVKQHLEHVSEVASASGWATLSGGESADPDHTM